MANTHTKMTEEHESLAKHVVEFLSTLHHIQVEPQEQIEQQMTLVVMTWNMGGKVVKYLL